MYKITSVTPRRCSLQVSQLPEVRAYNNGNMLASYRVIPTVWHNGLAIYPDNWTYIQEWENLPENVTGIFVSGVATRPWEYGRPIKYYALSGELVGEETLSPVFGDAAGASYRNRFNQLWSPWFTKAQAGQVQFRGFVHELSEAHNPHVTVEINSVLDVMHYDGAFALLHSTGRILCQGDLYIAAPAQFAGVQAFSRYADSPSTCVYADVEPVLETVDWVTVSWLDLDERIREGLPVSDDVVMDLPERVAVGGGSELEPATEDTLGGIKLGAGLVMNEESQVAPLVTDEMQILFSLHGTSPNRTASVTFVRGASTLRHEEWAEAEGSWSMETEEGTAVPLTWPLIVGTPVNDVALVYYVEASLFGSSGEGLMLNPEFSAEDLTCAIARATDTGSLYIDYIQ